MDSNEILLKVFEKLDNFDKKFDSLEQKIDSLEQGQIKMQKSIDVLSEDVALLKEDTTVTRSAVNTLLEWAEDAQVQVKIPLFKKAE